MKSFLQSKTVWLNGFLTLAGVATLVAEQSESGSFDSLAGWAMFVAGVAGIIIRVWFTDTAIG